MRSYHLYAHKTDPAKVAEFIQHCKDRIEHFTKTGSKTGVKYWQQRLSSTKGL